MSLVYSTRAYYNIALTITVIESLKYDRSKTAVAIFWETVSSNPLSMYVVCADAVIEGGV
jgi:hypothetical protein